MTSVKKRSTGRGESDSGGGHIVHKKLLGLAFEQMALIGISPRLLIRQHAAPNPVATYSHDVIPRRTEVLSNAWCPYGNTLRYLKVS